jgi:hypothetical protein
MEQVRLHAHDSRLRCPYCHDDVDLGQADLLACPACGAHHHPECVSEADPTLLTRRCCAHACQAELVLQRPAPEEAPVGRTLSRRLGALFGWSLWAAFAVTPVVWAFNDGVPGMGLFMALVYGCCTLAMLGQKDSTRGAPRSRTGTRSPRGPASQRASATPEPARKPRCLLCPQEAGDGRYCASHAALVGSPITTSPARRSVNPGRLFGPGRLDEGRARGGSAAT